jgi:hypothetical protein
MVSIVHNGERYEFKLEEVRPKKNGFLPLERPEFLKPENYEKKHRKHLKRLVENKLARGEGRTLRMFYLRDIYVDDSLYRYALSLDEEKHDYGKFAEKHKKYAEGWSDADLFNEAEEEFYGEYEISKEDQEPYREEWEYKDDESLPKKKKKIKN